MPLYEFKCDDCRKIMQYKLTMKEHSDKKDSITCDKCGKKAIQVVAPLRFTLKGEGWFINSQQNDNPYTITQNELNKNLDQMNYAEEYANTMMERDDKNLKAGIIE